MTMLYFAYGSNLNLEQMEWRCPHAEPIGPAILKGHALVFRGVADIAEDASREVIGGLWQITPECLKELDRYEGYPFFYGREELEVEIPHGDPVTAIVYKMTPESAERGMSPPSGGYFDAVWQGYRDFGLTEVELKYALARSLVPGDTRKYASKPKAKPAARPKIVTAKRIPNTTELRRRWGMNPPPTVQGSLSLAEAKAFVKRAKAAKKTTPREAPRAGIPRGLVALEARGL